MKELAAHAIRGAARLSERRFVCYRLDLSTRGFTGPLCCLSVRPAVILTYLQEYCLSVSYYKEPPRELLWRGCSEQKSICSKCCGLLIKRVMRQSSSLLAVHNARPRWDFDLTVATASERNASVI